MALFPDMKKTKLLVFGLISSILFLSAQEIAVRLALPEFDPISQLRFTIIDNQLPPLGQPNTRTRHFKNTGDFDVTVEFNIHGLRDRKLLADVRPRDLVIVGDSFPFGWGVRESQRVGEQIAQITSDTVYNVATGGGNIDDYRSLLDYVTRNQGQIGQALIFINMENDIQDYKDRSDAVMNMQNTQEISPPSALNFFKQLLLSNSAIYFATTSVIHQNVFLRMLAIKLGLITPVLRNVGGIEESPSAIESSAKRLANLSKDYPAIVVIIPSRALWLPKRRLAALRIHNLFRTALEIHNIQFIDLCPYFITAKQPLDLHFKNDGHWNARGHQYAAKAIAHFLSSIKTKKNTACAL